MAMGYPMSYDRCMGRNGLRGDYGTYASKSNTSTTSLIAGDLRRVETDQRDPAHLKAYARIAGITPEQAKAVLDAFFGSPYEHQEFADEMMFAWLDEEPERWNTKVGALYAKRRKEIYGT